MHLPPIVATVIYVIGIAGLFWLDRGRDREIRLSKALLLPTAWLLLTGSRPVSMWLGVSSDAGTATIYEEGSPADRAVYMALVAGALIVVLRRSA